jgi:hypothetical protein
VPGEYMSIKLAVTAEKGPGLCKPQRVLWQRRERVWLTMTCGCTLDAQRGEQFEAQPEWARPSAAGAVDPPLGSWYRDTDRREAFGLQSRGKQRPAVPYVACPAASSISR